MSSVPISRPAKARLPRPLRRLELPLIPASYFGIVLGLGGFANSWRAARVVWGAPDAIGEALFLAAAATWLVVVGLYAWKWIAAPDVALAEASHPIHCCFIGLGGVATLVMAQGALPYSRLLATILFSVGASFVLGFGLWRTGLLWRGKREAEANTPVLLLPIVAAGFVIAIVAGTFGWHAWAGLAFGAAFFSWLAIESVVLHRLYTSETLSAQMRPTLGLQLAPPTVGALAYLATGAYPAGLIPQALMGYALLQAVLLVRMWRWIAEQPFAPSYWAVTFGVTAMPVAMAKISEALPGHPFSLLSFSLFIASNLVLTAISCRTVVWIFRGPRN